MHGNGAYLEMGGQYWIVSIFSLPYPPSEELDIGE